jgi:hypothetical protein
VAHLGVCEDYALLGGSIAGHPFQPE